MSSQIYTANFRGSDTALTPTFTLFVKLSNGAAPTNPAPSVSAVGLGIYKFTYDAAEEVVFALDGGDAVPDPDRYVRGVLSPVDTRLDDTITSRMATFVYTAPDNATIASTGATVSTNLDAKISTVITDISRILALSYDNIVQDNQVYDANSKLTSALAKFYNSPANAALNDGVTGLLYQYSITATYDGGGNCTLFRMVRSGGT